MCDETPDVHKMPRHERIGLVALAVALALWALIFVLWLNAPYVAILNYP